MELKVARMVIIWSKSRNEMKQKMENGKQKKWFIPKSHGHVFYQRTIWSIMFVNKTKHKQTSGESCLLRLFSFYFFNQSFSSKGFPGCPENEQHKPYHCHFGLDLDWTDLLQFLNLHGWTWPNNHHTNTKKNSYFFGLFSFVFLNEND